MSIGHGGPLYPSRSGAGALLGQQLAARGHTGAVLLGITPEGVEIAAHAAKAMGAAFDVIVAAFIRLGSNLAPVGAMAESVPAEMDPDFQPGMSLMDSLQAAMDESRARVRQDLVLYRTLRPVKDLRSRRVVIVDGVVVFPWRVLAGARVAESLGATRVAIAMPVASQAAADRIRARGYEVVCPAVLVDADPKVRYFGDGGGGTPERLRAIMIAHQAA
jgi:predicted phosphoribosyltransferase